MDDGNTYSSQKDGAMSEGLHKILELSRGISTEFSPSTF